MVMMTIEYSWEDDFMKYSHIKAFENLSMIHQKNSNLWIPTLFVMNSASDKFSYNPPPNDLAEIGPDGTVTAILFTIFTVGCSLDLRKFAFKILIYVM